MKKKATALVPVSRTLFPELLLSFLILSQIYTFLTPVNSFSFEADITTTVTPSRLSLQKNKTSATISVIGEKELKRQEAFSVEEALRNLPGVYVQTSGTPGFGTGKNTEL